VRPRIDLTHENPLKMDGEPARWHPRSPPGRGEMAERFSRFDWSATPIGSPDTWPVSWRDAVQVILDSSFPTALGLGKQLVYFYNDAFIPIGGPARHPSALGLPVPIAWKEIWEPILLPRFNYTLETGAPTGEEALLMPLERSGYLEETYITFSFAALRDDEGTPSGIFCTAYEQTSRVIADRQLRCLRALAAQSSLAETPESACHAAGAILEDHPRDLPFALLYLLDRDGKRLQLAGTCGLTSTPAMVPASVTLGSGPDPWKLSVVVAQRRAEVVENVRELIGGAIRNTEVTPVHAVAIPIAGLGEEQLAGVLIAGANPMRPLDESRAFHELIAGQLETAISSAKAKQHARERAQALAELDRAKTVFFSNISHELRTPLTLLLAPLDDVLNRDHLTPVDREGLEIARRGGGRLLKLVNSLLEFSRIEAGRIEASYEPVDLATLTADLASVFRSAFERAGVALKIHCPALPEPVYVDRDMWEKVVLNLISNAFKFTFSGEVRISLEMAQDSVQLDVTDTGCGVAPEDLPRLFERFFRGRAPQARTHEGSGIGLSLVHELVKLHGGTIEASSNLGQGTTMTVRLPRGWAHLPADRICAGRTLERSRIGALPFVEEALGWLVHDSGRDHGAGSELQGPAASSGSSTASATDASPARILVVDDNADMRAYLCRLLRERWDVEMAQDGGTALIRISEQAPDLVIADVMMPGIDGFALLRRLRENEQTAEIPVMLLSARAGEEASAEGLRAGADDYLIKPFSARELVARVESRLTQARLRAAERRAREAAESANHARDNFFAMLSHELRTPLTAVMAWMPLLRDGQLDAADTVYALEAIERAARLQRRLVDDLLDVSQIVTGRLRIEERNIPAFAPIVCTIIDCFRPVAREKALRIETELDTEAGPLTGDPDRLQQVVWNLLTNAIKFTQAGGSIQIRCIRVDEHVELSVKDTGRGIAPEALAHIFERYWQGESPEHQRQGLGLGLAITQRIVELHGGSICAASDGEGHGATFTVRLPVAEPQFALPLDIPVEQDAHPAAATRALDAATAAAELDLTPSHRESEPFDAPKAQPGERCANALNALSILLVEDDDGIAKAFHRLLSSHGHSVVRARGAAQALNAMDRGLFDVLICDLTLRDGSGLELLPRIRASLARRGLREQLPAIAISGRAYPEDIVKCLSAGFAMHLAKPFDASTLLAAVAQVTRPLSGGE
jgi:signal transduction histidine kinase